MSTFLSLQPAQVGGLLREAVFNTPYTCARLGNRTEHMLWHHALISGVHCVGVVKGEVLVMFQIMPVKKKMKGEYNIVFATMIWTGTRDR